MAKTHYLLMKDSDQTNDDGVNRIDLFSFPINEFRQEDVILEYTLGENDVFRFDHLIRSFYGSIDYYLGMTKLLNGLFELDEDSIGTVIKLYSKSDLDSFLRENLLTVDKS